MKIKHDTFAHDPNKLKGDWPGVLHQINVDFRKGASNVLTQGAHDVFMSVIEGERDALGPSSIINGKRRTWS